ncbi:MAG: GGDEF domain-containing protein [bacterium]
MGEMDRLKDENEELKEKLKKLQKVNSSLKRIHENIQESIFVDEAIRLYNSRYLNIRLDEEMRRAKRYNQFLSLVLISVDFLVGDEMKDSPEEGRSDFTKKLGEFIKTNLRDTDIISLYHKDIIALILPETSVEGAVCLSERLKDQILFAFFNGEIDNCKKGNSVNIGITSYPTDARVIDELINNATHMLERSRGSEGNTIYCSIMN